MPAVRQPGTRSGGSRSNRYPEVSHRGRNPDSSSIVRDERQEKTEDTRTQNHVLPKPLDRDRPGRLPELPA